MKIFYKNTNNLYPEKFDCIHHNDLDGYSSACIVADEMGVIESIPLDRFHKTNYSQYKTDFESDTTVFIVDVSFTDNTYDKLLEICTNASKVIWIDHHQSSVDLFEKHRDVLDGLLEGYLLTENGYSAAYLVYLYFTYTMTKVFNEFDMVNYDVYLKGYKLSDVETVFDRIRVPLFIKYVSDYDTWTKRLPYCDEFNYGVMAKVNSVESVILSSFIAKQSELYIRKDEKEAIDVIIEAGKNIMEYLKMSNAKLVKSNAYVISMRIPRLIKCTFNCIMLNASGNSLVFGDTLFEPDIDFGICYTYNGEEYKYSIYKNPKSDIPINSNDIAEIFGGGGHKGAAGFRLPTRLEDMDSNEANNKFFTIEKISHLKEIKF